jgi:hypothetical protein
MSNFDYDSMAQRVIQAQTAFRQIYEQTNPAPLPPSGRAKRDWLGRMTLVLVMLGAVIVSGSHTVTVFSIGKTGFVGGAAFIMLELGLLIFSFQHTRETYRSRDDVRVVGFLNTGARVTFGVLVVGNVFDVLQVNGFATGALWTVISFAVSLSVALSAPVVAYIVGHTLAMLIVQDNALDLRARADYEKAKATWIEEFMRVWNANKNRWGATVTVESDTPRLTVSDNRLLSMSTQTDSRQTGSGYNRVSSAVDKAYQWLVDNPDKMDMSVRELADVIGVGKDSVAKARNKISLGRNGDSGGD